MALSFVYDGDAYFTLQYNGDVLDTAQGLDSWILNPSEQYPYYCFFNSGQSTSLVDGVSLTGQTSGAVIRVGRVITTGGALGSNTGAGVLFFYKVSGEIVSGENLRVSTTTYCIAASAARQAPVGLQARSITVMVETNSIRYTCGGVAPTNAAGTPASFGVLVAANENFTVSGWHDVRTFQIIHAVSTSNAAVNMIVRY